MTLIPEYYQSLIRAAADDLRSLLWPENQDDAKTVQKGLILYRQGLVTNTRLEKDAATAVVHDVVPVHIKLDLHFFKKSTCSCPAKGICRHQLAAFFHIYSKVDSVSDWMEQWRLPLRTNGLPNIPGLKRAKDLLKQKEPQPDYDRWVANCIDAFHEVMPREETVPASEVYAYFHVYYRKIKTGAPVAREWRTLYFLIAALHSLHLLLLYSGEINHSEDEVGRYYGPALSSLLDEAKEAAGILSIHSVPFAFDPFLEKLRADASFLLDDELGQRKTRLELYMFLWTKLFKKEAWRQEELQNISARPESPSLLAAAAFQHVMLKEDGQALKVLAKLGKESAALLPDWFEEWSAHKEWERIGPFARHFAGVFGPFLQTLGSDGERKAFMEKSFAALDGYFSGGKSGGLYEQLLMQALPYSYEKYEEFLFGMKEYEKWADLHIYMGADLDSLPAGRLEFLERENPAALLPLYHQTVQKHIAVKNRANYREAVGVLKQLRGLYRELRRESDWREFFGRLAEETKRLRAFQEECERGGLFHA